jgi:RNA polymerase sigma-70 factor (ECF subfamily)
MPIAASPPDAGTERTTDAGRAAEEFERHRRHLIGVAYRILGTLADAEDAVQEAYLRFTRVELGSIREPRAWLTTAVGRVALDMLGSARARRERYVGPWLPEPVVDGARGLTPPPIGPEDRVTLDESVSMAVLRVLESLSPAERTSFVLREVFGLPYGEVSSIVGRDEAACRQLVSRAKAHLRQGAPRFGPDAGQHTRAVEAFVSATTGGSFEALAKVLDPDVVLRSDGGGRVPGIARRPVLGADNVARLLLGVAAKNPEGTARIGRVNGSSGVIFEAGGQVVGVMGFTVAGGRITELDFVVNPEKLQRVAPADERQQ